MTPKSKVKTRERQGAQKSAKRNLNLIVKNIVNSMVPQNYIHIGTQTGVTAGGIFGGLFTLTPGTGPGKRLGDKVRLDKMNFRFHWDFGDVSNVCRVIFFQERTRNVPTQTTILNIGPTGLVDVDSCWLANTEKERIILYDQRFVTQSSGTHTAVCREIVLKPPLFQTYQVGTNLFEEGGIYFCLLSDSSILPNPNFLMDGMVWYKEG